MFLTLDRQPQNWQYGHFCASDTQKKREAKKAEKAAKKATHKAAAADGGDMAQDQDDGPDISVGK